jgi:hypothetical protein
VARATFFSRVLVVLFTQQAGNSQSRLAQKLNFKFGISKPSAKERTKKTRPKAAPLFFDPEAMT